VLNPQYITHSSTRVAKAVEFVSAQLLDDSDTRKSCRLDDFGRDQIASLRVSEVSRSTAMKSGLSAAIFQVLAAADSFLRVGRNVAFALLHTDEVPDYPLTSSEACVLSSRVSKRTRDRFALGRAAAHLALEHLGIERSFPILRGQDGEPLWPAGVAGSISHCDPWTVAVAATGPGRFTLGIDLESIVKVSEFDISQLLCSEKEIDWVKAGDDSERRLALLFSAKEATYKAFYPLCHRYIDFKEVTLSPHVKEESFRGELITPINVYLPAGASFQVRCRCYGDLVFSYIDHVIG